MNVLILSKTHMNGGKCCVGGITDDGRSVRLLTIQGENQPENTELAPRQIYDIKFTERSNLKPPHVEDVLIQTKTFKRNLESSANMADIISQRGAPIWRGHPEHLFEEKLQWTPNGSGYVNENSIPSHSVGFWIADKPLSKSIYYGKVRYSYRGHETWFSLPYVGFEDAVPQIPSGTLLRVSLARWWDQDGKTEPRCSLQLSGWYDL